ncbi:hypothetical protein WJX73_001746 [Symbiochloris irregularis]|uniref:Spindle assembly abnormal protein 6 N-terminal domain-containing protein n=1 Tax=Symbiochloris irregularis TaxID=706552 RepID=A0AAW1P7L6_9CHLO
MSSSLTRGKSNASALVHEVSGVGPDAIEIALHSAMDTSCLSLVDPSKAEGYEALFDDEVLSEVRSSEAEAGEGIGQAPQALRVRVLVAGDPSRPSRVRAEIVCEHDLFLYYAHEVDEEQFAEMKDAQKLTCDWKGYPQVLLRLLQQSAKAPHHFVIFIKQSDSSPGRLWFVQNMEHKFVELLSVEFSPVEEDMVRDRLDYRYKAVKAQLAIVQACLADVYAVIKLKNPSLLRQLQNIPQRVSGAVHIT